MTIKIEGLEDLNEVLAKLPAEFDREATKIVNSSAIKIRYEAQKSIISRQSQGRTYTKSDPYRKHIASAPGYPPNTDTGYLAGHIEWREAGKATAHVNSHASYSADLEFGRRNMEARPFMTPAVEKERPNFMKNIKGIVSKVAK
jgi:HK97 gp10 family phage protein